MVTTPKNKESFSEVTASIKAGLQSRYLSLMNLEKEAEKCVLAYHGQRKSFLVFKIKNKTLQ